MRMGRRWGLLLLVCVGAAAVTFALLSGSSSPAKKPAAGPTAAVGPSGRDRPAYPGLLRHILSGATSIEIRGAGGITTVNRPGPVWLIAHWLGALPHAPSGYVSAGPACSGFRPLDVRFDFRDGKGRVLLSAVDHISNPLPGYCPGSISFNGRELADEDFRHRDFTSAVSHLVGVDLTASPQTLQREETAKRDALRLLGRVRVPPGSRLVKTVAPTIDGPDLNDVTAERVWRVRLPFLQVYKWTKAHPPRDSDTGDFSDAFGSSPSRASRGDGYSYPPLAGIPYRELDLQVWHFVHHGVWTRIEADVTETWTVARPSAEKIPGGVRALVIHGLGRHVRRIRNPDVIARVVRWFDSRDVIQSFVGECGINGRPLPSRVRIAFVGTTGTVLATATDPRTNHAYGGHCNPISLRVRGQKQPELDPGYDDWFERFLR